MSNCQTNNNDINYSLFKNKNILISKYLLKIVLYPVDLEMNFVIKLIAGEHNYHRPTFDINSLIKELTLNIDSKQFSDLLDFAKFQNYSLLYGNLLISFSFIYLFKRTMPRISSIAFSRIN
jgi:hypothetical protein